VSHRLGRLLCILALLIILPILTGCSAQTVEIEDGVPLSIPTADGADQIAHPTVIDFTVEYGLEGWGGYRYWMSASPYPGADDYHENPCLWVSDDGTQWKMVQGLAHPLVEVPEKYRKRSVYHSDPSIVYNPRTDVIELYYRESQGRSEDAAVVLHRIDISAQSDQHDTDRFHYTVTEVALSTPSFTRVSTCLSPSVVIDDEGTHIMFAVGNASGTSGVSAFEVMVMQGGVDGVAYGAPRVCREVDDRFIESAEGFGPNAPWHLTAKRDPHSSEIALLINGQSFGEGRRLRNLYWAFTNFDNPTAMTYPQTTPLLRGQSGWQPYRSAFVLADFEHEDSLRLWLNVYTTPTQVWSIVYLGGN